MWIELSCTSRLILSFTFSSKLLIVVHLRSTENMYMQLFSHGGGMTLTLQVCQKRSFWLGPNIPQQSNYQQRPIGRGMAVTFLKSLCSNNLYSMNVFLIRGSGQLATHIFLRSVGHSLNNGILFWHCKYNVSLFAPCAWWLISVHLYYDFREREFTAFGEAFVPFMVIRGLPNLIISTKGF